MGDLWNDVREERREKRNERLDKAADQINRTTAALAKLGLTLNPNGPYGFHIRRDCKVIAQWWPSGGKTMLGQRRGKRCFNGEQLVRWLQDERAVWSDHNVADKEVDRG